MVTKQCNKSIQIKEDGANKTRFYLAPQLLLRKPLLFLGTANPCHRSHIRNYTRRWSGGKGVETDSLNLSLKRPSRALALENTFCIDFRKE